MGYAAAASAAMSMLSSYGAQEKLGDVQTIKKKGYNKQLQQAKMALLAQAAPELLAGLKLAKGQAKGLGKDQYVSFGGQKYRIPTSAEFDKLTSDIETQNFQKIEQTRQKLSESPLFKSIFARAGGDFGLFDKELTEGFAKIGSRALGASSAMGTINNPAVANRALGPLALERAQFLQNLQLGSEQQAVNATLGLPFTSGNLSSPLGIQGHQQGLFNQFQVNSGIGGSNAGMMNQAAANQASFLGGLSNSFAGFAGQQYARNDQLSFLQNRIQGGT